MPRQTQPTRSSDRRTAARSSEQKKSSRSKGSVTKALARARGGEPLDERVYAYVYASLKRLASSKRFHQDGLPLDGEDVLQDFMLRNAASVARGRDFERREDFAAFCAAIVQKQFTSHQRREFGTTGRRKMQRLTVENAADLSDRESVLDESDFAAQRKLCREIKQIAGRRLSQFGRLERVVVCRWIRTGEGAVRLHEYVQRYVKERNLSDVRPLSERTISRLIHRFPRDIADSWNQEHGSTWSAKDFEEIMSQLTRRKNASSR